jgi:hypothetical protein
MSSSPQSSLTPPRADRTSSTASSPMLSTPADLLLPDGSTASFRISTGPAPATTVVCTSPGGTTTVTASSPPAASYQMDPAVYKQLLQLPGNDSCIECSDSKRRPDWVRIHAICLLSIQNVALTHDPSDALPQLIKG